jgi:peptidyl-prolyl cis-trans isomerase D
MSGEFRKKTSGMFITVFIGFIVVSFVISGYDGEKGGSTTIGVVGNYKIEVSEFQNAYERQVNLYKQIYGGKELTAKDIQQLKLRENIVKQLVQQKLVLVFADKIGIIPSQEQVRDSILNYSQGDQKIFQTKGVFNLDLYKKMLATARLTPAQFENQTETMIKNQTVLQLISKVPLSNSFSKEIEDLKKRKIKTDFLVIDKKQMEPFVPVTEKEISDYLAKNSNQLKAKFDIVKNKLTKPEEIKVKHILIYKDEENQEKILKDLAKNLNSKNFAKMAEKYNRGVEEKKNGGELGWIPKGRGIPEFDIAFSLKPGTVTPLFKSQYGSHYILVEDKKPGFIPNFESLKNSMAKEMIQGGKPFEVEKLVQNLAKEIGELLKADKLAKAEDVAKKYNLKIQKGIFINQLDGGKGVLNIPSDSIMKMFNENLEKPKTFVIASPTGISLVRASMADGKTGSETGDSKDNISNELSQILAADITNSIREKVKVSINRFYE